MDTAQLTAPLIYHVSLLHPEAHSYRVRLTIPQPDPQGQRLRLPAWVIGSYLIRDLAKHVLSFTAQCHGVSIASHKQDKHTWVCAPCAGLLVVEYTVYAFDRSVRGAYLDLRRGFFDGASLFLEAVGVTPAPCHLHLARPYDPRLSRWQAATAMPALATDADGYGQYASADYAELLDHPVMLGALTTLEFTAAGVAHQLVVQGRHTGDLERLRQDTAKIAATQIALFGGSPVQRYVFLLRLTDEGYGGLEHRASCSLVASCDDLPRTGMDVPSPGYRKLLGLISHEYFHTWWVKAVKPLAFCPYDLRQENYTELLWVFEGITSYYDDYLLLRAGVISRESYLELLAQSITRLWRTPGRECQSLAEASFDAWHKFYQPNENSPNSQVSYYLKGSLVALALDLTLRQGSGGLHNLDGLMRQIWREHGLTGIGLPEQGFEQYAESYAGQSLTAFFAANVRGTGELALQPLLSACGITLHACAANTNADNGGYAKLAPPTSNPRASLGASWNAQAAEATLTTVFTGGAAQQAGLNPGDTLIALDGLRLSGRNLEARLANATPGAVVALHVFRRHELLTFTVMLQAATTDTCYLSLSEPPNAAAAARHTAWLGLRG